MAVLAWKSVDCIRCGLIVIRSYPEGSEPPLFCSRNCKSRYSDLMRRARARGAQAGDIASLTAAVRRTFRENRTPCPLPAARAYLSYRDAWKHTRSPLIERCECGLYHP